MLRCPPKVATTATEILATATSDTKFATTVPPYDIQDDIRNPKRYSTRPSLPTVCLEGEDRTRYSFATLTKLAGNHLSPYNDEFSRFKQSDTNPWMKYLEALLIL